VKVILDANALMMPVQFGIDIMAELGEILGSFEAVTLEEVRTELAGIARGRGRDAAAARFGLSLASRCTTVAGSGFVAGTVDERIIRYAEAHNGIVVTNDRIVKNALLDRGMKVISLRKQKKLEIMRA
jgi:rRNA-processing protein FCF1